MTGKAGDHTNDVFGEVLSERNQCLPIHLASGFLCGSLGRKENFIRPDVGGVLHQARKLRREQYLQAVEC